MSDINKNSDPLAAQIKPGGVEPTVRTPDGAVDHIETALNKLRIESGSNPHPKQCSSLEVMTEWLRTHEIDSPKPTFKDRLHQEADKARETMADFRRGFTRENFISVFWFVIALTTFCLIAAFIQSLFQEK